jgi:hypothetical protein
MLGCCSFVTVACHAAGHERIDDHAVAIREHIPRYAKLASWAEVFRYRRASGITINPLGSYA